INDLKAKIKKQDTEYSNKIDVLNSEKNNILARYNILESRNHEYQSRFKFITTSIIFIALLTICIFIIDNHKISERDKTIETLTLENQTQMNDLQKQRDELFAQQKALQSSQKAELLLPSENSPSSNNCSYNKSEIDISLTVAHDVIYERIKKATHTSGILSGKLIIGINSVSWITTKNTLTSKVSPTWLTQTIENSYKYPANCTGKPIEVTWVFKF
ncbi:MAG: hypothetical protein IKY83_04745, partial [Proteobacteria bacterium]|nr:hypothetical protein [Pseudomonadota bacterium]